MATLIGSILRQATRIQEKPLNILSFSTHERYQTGLARTGHNFYLFQGENIKGWNPTYAPLPANHTLLNPSLGIHQIPIDLDLDCILSQNKFGQFPVAAQLARALHLPLISLEHTLPVPDWDNNRLKYIQSMQGNINIFISEYSGKAWGWDEGTYEIIHHGIDTEVFSPGPYGPKLPHVLSIVNDFANRDWCCGFNLWRYVTKDLPVKLLGDTPGLSKPAKDIAELVTSYRQAQVFLNTSLISPIPTVLLEAMACLPPTQDIFFGYDATPIEEIYKLQTLNENTLGDRILKKICSDYNGDIISIKANHIPTFKLTENHPVATVDITHKFDSQLRLQSKRPYHKVISKHKWKNAGDLNENDWLVIPKFKTTHKLGMSKEWLQFYGLFLAEGNTSAGNIQFTLHENEIDLIDRITVIATQLNREITIRKLKDEKAVQVTFTHGPLARKLREMFQHLAYQKSIPREFMEASADEIKVFLHSYLDGDGYIDKKGYQSCSTSSKQLAYQIMLLMTKLNILPSISRIEQKVGCIRGRVIRWSIKHNRSKKLYLEDDNNFYVRIKKISRIAYIGKVYNLSTESNTFNVPFIKTHNCGCAVVSTDTCMIPDIIQHGENGLLGSSPDDLRSCVNMLLEDEGLARHLGDNARRTIVERFNMDQFVRAWDDIFTRASTMPFTGV